MDIFVNFGSVGSGVVFGLLAALCWGGGDVCGGLASRKGSTFLTLLGVEILALLALLALLPTGLLTFTHAPTLEAVAAAAGLNLLILLGAGLIYRAFAIGKIALVAPLAAAYGAVSAALALLTGERVSTLAVLGIVLTLLGVIRATTPPQHASRASGAWRGVPEALGAMLVWGVAFWALRYPVEHLGSIPVVFLGKLTDLGLLLLVAAAGLVFGRMQARRAARGKGHLGARADVAAAAPAHWYDLRLPGGAFWLFVVPAALFDVGANVAYALGLATSLTLVVAVFSSLSGAVAVLLGWLLFKERLTRWQWVGVLVILAGIVLVNV